MFRLLHKLIRLVRRSSGVSRSELQPYAVAPPEVLRDVKSNLLRRLAGRFKRGFDSTAH
jgi:hypothetical protein